MFRSSAERWAGCEGWRGRPSLPGRPRVQYQVCMRGRIANLRMLTDARGNATGFTYDAMNRQLTRTDPLNRTEHSVYDYDGNVVQFTDRRGLISSFAYDPLDRLVTETYSDASVTRSYDGNGRVVKGVDSASGSFFYGYL